MVYANGVALSSDRNAKENLATVNTCDVLDKVATLPMSEWQFKATPGSASSGADGTGFPSGFRVGRRR